MPTAILVDGDFFLRCYRVIFGHPDEPAAVAKKLHGLCLQHLKGKNNQQKHELYRIFFYDCPPLTKKAHHPLTGKPVDFSKTPLAQFRHQLHMELRKLRKVALRLGYLDEYNAKWTIKPDKTKALLAKQIGVDDLTEADVIYHARQKGVDMRIGMDIASLAYKRQVDQIILIAGDSDFVPAAKLARREGIDFKIMAEPLAYQVLRKIGEAHEFYHHLILMVGPTGSGKTSGCWSFPQITRHGENLDEQR